MRSAFLSSSSSSVLRAAGGSNNLRAITQHVPAAFSLVPLSSSSFEAPQIKECNRHCPSFSYSPLSTKRYASTITPILDSIADSASQDGDNKKQILDNNTPLGSSSAAHLLNGLDVYQVTSNDDHPISVYGIHSTDIEEKQEQQAEKTIPRRPILLLHGRTWSSVPVYHLLGGGSTCDGTNDEGEVQKQKSRSLMESLYDMGLQPYTMDFRGFGGTPMDSTKSVIPNRCVQDVEAVLDFITSRHQKLCRVEESSVDGAGDDGNSNYHLPALLGWSQGALVAQLTAQKISDRISKLILYGSIYDPLINYPRSPLYSNGTSSELDGEDSRRANTFNEAIEDFTVEGSIPPEPATRFAEAALLADPFKAEWRYLCQFNNLDPARIHIPTLVIAGDQDPYAPLRVQAHLFSNLGRGIDRTWSIIADADHAVHLLDGGKERFLNIVTSFVDNGKKGESEGSCPR